MGTGGREYQDRMPAMAHRNRKAEASKARAREGDMTDTAQNNRRIAKNTMFLYFRMAITMMVKLYTSRVLLNVLGVDDYGTWNVVAAFVISFSFISSPLVTATQRFLNFEMGKGGKELSHIFNTCLELFFIVGIIVIIALETGGLWFLNNKMTFPTEKIETVNSIYQLTVATLFINLIRMPYESSIIAYERMSFYAIICILETTLLLATAFALQLELISNRLVLYGIFTFASSIAVLASYIIYCNRNFSCTRIKPYWNWEMFKSIGSFSGWNLFGAASSMTANQGVNILINIFHGVTFNATYGIAMQVRGAVSVLVDNLHKAANPQIVNNYAKGDTERVRFLVSSMGKYSFLLVFAFVFPIAINIDFLLKLWLGSNLPPQCASFAICTLIQLLLVCMTGPMDTAVFATGKIRNYQLALSGIILMNVVLSYFAFKAQMPVITAMIIKCIIEVFILAARIAYLRIMIDLDIKKYFKETIGPIMLTIAISMSAFYAITRLAPLGKEWHRLFLSVSVFLPMYIISTWFICFSASQRKYCKDFLMTKINLNKYGK